MPLPRTIPLLLVFMCLFCHTFVATAQAEGIWLLPQAPPRIGDPVLVTLRLQLPDGAQPFIPAMLEAWNASAEFAGEIETRPVGTVRYLTDGSRAVEQDFEVLFWRPGNYTLAPMVIAYQLAEGQAQTLTVPETQLDVASVLIPGDREFRSLPPTYPVSLFGLILSAVVAVLVLLLTTVIFVLRRQVVRVIPSIQASREREKPQVAYNLEHTLVELENIQRSSINNDEKYSRSLDFIRHYIGNRLGAVVFEMTSVELLQWIEHTRRVSPQLLDELARLMAESDLARFSGDAPSDVQVRYFVQRARNWVIQTHEHVRSESEEEDGIGNVPLRSA
jgi:hypothetical protein